MCRGNGRSRSSRKSKGTQERDGRRWGTWRGMKCWKDTQEL